MATRPPVVLVVDAVTQYLGEDGALADALATAEAATEVVRTARAAGVHVLHTHLAFRADGIDGGHYFQRNPSLAAFAGRPISRAAGLEPAADELVVPRSYPSAFFGTSLSATVRGAEASTVVLVGATSSGGIRAAAIDALQHGFVPVVVSDAVADVTRARHADALRDLDDHYADVTSTAEAMAYLHTAASN